LKKAFARRQKTGGRNEKRRRVAIVQTNFAIKIKVATERCCGKTKFVL